MLEIGYLIKNYRIRNYTIYDKSGLLVSANQLLFDLIKIFSITLNEGLDLVTKWLELGGVSDTKKYFCRYHITIDNNGTPIFLSANKVKHTSVNVDYVNIGGRRIAGARQFSDLEIEASFNHKFINFIDILSLRTDIIIKDTFPINPLINGEYRYNGYISRVNTSVDDNGDILTTVIVSVNEFMVL